MKFLIIFLIVLFYDKSTAYSPGIKNTQTNPFHGHNQPVVSGKSDVNLCEVWNPEIQVNDGVPCNHPKVDKTLFGSCWSVTWDARPIPQGFMYMCSCLGNDQMEISLKCGNNITWYLGDQNQLHLCGKYAERCNKEFCPDLSNNLNFQCNNNKAGRIGDNRDCSCKHTCQNINVICVRNQNQGYWKSDISCDEKAIYSYKDTSNNLEVTGSNGGFQYKCLPGSEMDSHSQSQVPCKTVWQNDFDSPACLPLKTKGNPVENGREQNNGILFTTSLPDHIPLNNNNKEPWTSPESGNGFQGSPYLNGGNNYNQGFNLNKNVGHKHQGGHTLPSTASQINDDKKACKLMKGVLIGIIVFLLLIIIILCLVLFFKLRNQNSKDIELENEVTAPNPKQEYMQTNENYVPADELKAK